MVDAAKADVRFSMQDFIDRQFNTINWGTAAGPGLYTIQYVRFVQPQRITDGNGMSHPRLGLVWCNYYYTPQIFDRFNQVPYARSRDAVVVCNQYNWFFFALFCHFLFFCHDNPKSTTYFIFPFAWKHNWKFFLAKNILKTKIFSILPQNH
jgi:hypothetical protein